jgi:error-prone DNA polymerase
MPWRELERRLSGRPAPEETEREWHGPSEVMGDGGDSVAWSRHRPAYEPPPLHRPTEIVPYAELHAHSSFSHLDGASLPEELVEQAVEYGLTALALTDHNGMYGVPRFAEAAQSVGLATVYGAELSLDIPVPATSAERSTSARAGASDPPGRHLLALARDPAGYASLCRAISNAQRRGGAKGRPVYDLDELTDLADGHWLVLTGCRKGPVRTALEAGRLGTFGLDPARRALEEMVGRFGRDNVVVELGYARDPLADERYDALTMLAGEERLPTVATTGAHYHGAARRPLATAMAAVRARRSLPEMDGWLPAWADQMLRTGADMAQRFGRWPGVVTTSTRLAAELAFPIQLIAPELPPFPVPQGHDEMTYLRELAMAGAERRYGPRGGVNRDGADNSPAYTQIEHELAIIDELSFPGYFLVVWDLVQFARRSGILCQGRGSAACSAVCYALEITAVDAVKYGLLFERFLAPERGEPPDIDIDIESGRREEVIQYVYNRHGRDHAAQVANVITYRPRSALRDVAKALGYSTGQQDAWSKQIEHGYDGIDLDGVPPEVIRLADELRNTPRHLGIHSGGMVICDRPVIEVCPVEWGRMPGRTVLQWDKDDCAAIGLVKFDLLGLGMLSALRYSFELIAAWHGTSYDLDTIPKESVCVYDMVCAADTVGVFQIESRAQMATLPRLRPRNFYDLAVEIALIRPGPIQGDSVHPYIRRRHGREPVADRTTGAHAGHPAVPGAADADCGSGGRLHARRGRPAAAGDGLQALRREDRRDAAAAVRRHGRAGDHGRTCGRDRRQDQGVCGVRVRREPLDLLCAPGLRLVLAQAALPGGVLRRAAERPADGLLLTAVAGLRRPPPRCRGARPGHQHLRGRREPAAGGGTGAVRPRRVPRALAGAARRTPRPVRCPRHR